jgi:hypothetical protein
MTLFNKIQSGSKLFQKANPENSIFKKLNHGSEIANAALKVGQFIIPHYHNVAQKHLQNHNQQRKNHNDLEKAIR